MAITNGSGGYQLGPLRPGRYLIDFLASCGASGYKSQRWKNASSARSATTVLVKSGQSKPGIDAAMARQK